MAVAIRELDHGSMVAIVDALGHGFRAHEMAEFVKAWLERSGTSDVVKTLNRLDRASQG